MTLMISITKKSHKISRESIFLKLFNNTTYQRAIVFIINISFDLKLVLNKRNFQIHQVLKSLIKESLIKELVRAY